MNPSANDAISYHVRVSFLISEDATTIRHGLGCRRGRLAPVQEVPDEINLVDFK